MKHPLFVFKDSASKHPVLVVALSITYKKEMEDYKFLADCINGFVKDQLIYGTDGEPAPGKCVRSRLSTREQSDIINTSKMLRSC